MNSLFRVGFQWNCTAQDVAAWVNMQILYDYNNSSWYEVWENRLKVSWRTDGPAGLFWWVTMVMWIWPYLCLIFLLPPTPPPPPPHQILPLISWAYMSIFLNPYVYSHGHPLKASLLSHQPKTHTFTPVCPLAYVHTYFQPNQAAPAVLGVTVASSHSTCFLNPGEVSCVPH